MPSTRRKNGTFRDIAHPLNNETRRLIEEKVFRRYDEVLAAERGPSPLPPRPALPRRVGGAASHQPPDPSPSLGF